jgi:hypothetical protein
MPIDYEYIPTDARFAVAQAIRQGHANIPANVAHADIPLHTGKGIETVRVSRAQIENILGGSLGKPKLTRKQRKNRAAHREREAKNAARATRAANRYRNKREQARAKARRQGSLPAYRDYSGFKIRMDPSLPQNTMVAGLHPDARPGGRWR